MPLNESEKEFLEPGIIEYLKARSISSDKEIEAVDALKSQIRSIRPDIRPEAITTAIGESEPNSTMVIGGEMQDLKFHRNDMLEKLSRRL